MQHLRLIPLSPTDPLPFPLLLLGAHSGAWATVAKVIGWAFTLWGTGLYWWAAVLCTVQVRQVVEAGHQSSGELKGAEPRP